MLLAWLHRVCVLKLLRNEAVSWRSVSDIDPALDFPSQEQDVSEENATVLMLDTVKVCLEDQFCSINVQKKQLNWCFRQLAVELHGNWSEGVTDNNKSAKATIKQN